MKGNPVLYKTLVVGVIALFIGAGIQPAIAEKQTHDYTLITPSIFGLKKQQISLTSEQSDKLDDIFYNLHEQLKIVGSIEEAKLVYKRTIDILVDNDLLPKSDAFLIKKLLFSNIVYKFYSASEKQSNIQTRIQGKDCMIAGETTETRFFNSIIRQEGFLDFIIALLLVILKVLPLRYIQLVDISFGYFWQIDHGEGQVWSEGWISIENNISMFDRINGEFLGALSKIDLNYGLHDQYYGYLGVYNFHGLVYHGKFQHLKDYFLGHAGLVDINVK